MTHKKIVAVLDTEPQYGGEHQYAVTMMECLLRMKDIEILSICGSRFWRKWCRGNGVRSLDAAWYYFTEREQRRHLRFPTYSRICCIYAEPLGKLLRKERVVAVLMARQALFVPNLGIKVIAPVHDLMHRYEGRFPEVSRDYDAREQVFSSQARYAWCILTDSKTGKRQFAESYAQYMRRGLPHIASLPFIVPKYITENKEEAIAVPPRYIFYPAQLWQHKNHLNLLRAIGMLVDEIADIHLVLAGAEKNNLKKINGYITENKLQEHVTITGFVDEGNIIYLYRHAVGMVMPSYFGPTNIPPLEAMALGCPVAVSNKYAMPEQVGDAGLLFDPDSPEEIADCIRRMWRDDMLRQEMIRKGYEQMGKWTEIQFHRKLSHILGKL